jgi:tRNA threonylcarbamoyladenosine biosynthesis protein TsaE
VILHTRSPDETEALGAALAAACRGGEALLVSGDLGAGKTRLAKGVARGLGLDPEAVTSPTFTLLAMYRGRLPFYHVDLYRLTDPEELISLELFDELEGPGVTLVEWPERGGRHLPPGLALTIEGAGDGPRAFTFAPPPADHAHLLTAISGFAPA